MSLRSHASPAGKVGVLISLKLPVTPRTKSNSGNCSPTVGINPLGSVKFKTPLRFPTPSPLAIPLEKYVDVGRFSCMVKLLPQVTPSRPRTRPETISVVGGRMRVDCVLTIELSER